MAPLNSRLYRVLEVSTNLVWLNALWLLACLPVLTFGPATAALFGVVRLWARGEEPPLTKTFFALMREDFTRNLLVGISWTALGTLLTTDFLLASQMEMFGLPLAGAFMVGGLLYASASVYLFPVMARYSLGPWTVMKNALLLALVYPLTTLAGLLVVILAAFVVSSVPMFLLVAGSASAYALHGLCDSALGRIEARKGSASTPDRGPDRR